MPGCPAQSPTLQPPTPAPPGHGLRACPGTRCPRCRATAAHSTRGCGRRRCACAGRRQRGCVVGRGHVGRGAAVVGPRSRRRALAGAGLRARRTWARAPSYVSRAAPRTQRAGSGRGTRHIQPRGRFRRGTHLHCCAAAAASASPPPACDCCSCLDASCRSRGAWERSMALSGSDRRSSGGCNGLRAIWQQCVAG